LSEFDLRFDVFSELYHRSQKMKVLFAVLTMLLTVAGIASAQIATPTTYRTTNLTPTATTPTVTTPPVGYSLVGCDGAGCDGAGCNGMGCDGAANRLWGAAGSGCDGNACDGNGRGGRFGLGNGCCGNSCGEYHSFFGGLVIPQNLNLTGALDGLDLDLKRGWMVGHAWGRQLNSCWRGELETSYRNSSVADLERSGVSASGDMAGSLNVMAGMLNAVRDFGSDCSRFRPYAGVGAGVAFIDLEARDPAVGFIDSRESAFAYQAFVGASRRIRNCVDLYGEYRVFGTHDFCADYNDPNGGLSPSGSTYIAHNFIVGLRIWTR
jgi:hypothetical protein